MLLFSVAAFAQDTYYVHGDTGNDTTGTGASGAPWKTLAKVKTATSGLANDTVNIAGTFREYADFRDEGNGLTIQQWSGQTPAWIRGDTAATGFSIGTNVGTDDGTYTKNIGTGLTIRTVTANWDSQVNSFGQHYGHLTPAATLVACNGTNNTWFYNSGTGFLYVRIGANANPSGYTVTYVSGSLNGLDVGSTTSTAAAGITVKNLTFALWCSPSAGTGYGLRLYSCQNSLSDGNVYYDCGYHSQGLVNYNGVPMRNVWEKNSSTFGITAAGDSAYVAYADTGGIDVESGFENCYVRLSPYLGMDGNPIAQTGVTSATAIGIVCHTTALLNIKKFKAVDCLVSVGTTHSSMTNRLGSYRTANVALPGNPDDWRTYGAILLRCHTTTGVLSLFKGSTAWVYSVIDLSQAGTSGAARITNGGVLGDNASIDAVTYMLWHGCDIRVNLDISSVAADHSMMFQVRGNTGTLVPSHIRLIGCSVVNTSLSTAAQVRGIFGHIITASPTIYARQTIFMHRLAASGANHNNLTYNNSGIDTVGELALLNFKDCWYVNMDSDRYASGTYVNDSSEWVASIDANGIYGTRSPFLDESGASPLWLNGFGKSYSKFVSPNIIEGINRRQYGGSHKYGAYQYGKEATTVPPL